MSIGIKTCPYKVGQKIRTDIYGKMTLVEVLEIHPWTLDVMRLSDGKCFRVTGLYW